MLQTMRHEVIILHGFSEVASERQVIKHGQAEAPIILTSKIFKILNS